MYSDSRKEDIILTRLRIGYSLLTLLKHYRANEDLFAAGKSTTDGNCAQSSVVHITPDRHSSFIILHHVQTDICLLLGIV